LERRDYLSNDRSKALMDEYQGWKEKQLEESGWFPIFIEFKDKELLKNLSGNALKLYIYLGIHSKNSSGISWHSLETIGKYFGKSPRTISNWLDDLKEKGLIERIQLDRSTTAITFLKPY
jgi:DNA-binding transcriptional ArsR family regulator